MGLKSLEELAGAAVAAGEPLWRVVLAEDVKERQVTEEESFAKMEGMYQAMQKADQQYDGKLRSRSGLSGGDGTLLQDYLNSGESLCGDFITTVMMRAVKMGESNACMKRIVAAPTAGSCGVLPAVLLTMEERYNFSLETMTEALYVAAGIGAVIADRAFISGAQGGCQAEIGSASAMAAGAATYLRGGTTEPILHACAMALKNLLGLTCDPVAGLVEVPCIKRNILGAVNALTSADAALAGVRSAIPPDEVIDSMRSIGCMLPKALRETGEGGLAVSPAGLKIMEKQRKE